MPFRHAHPASRTITQMLARQDVRDNDSERQTTSNSSRRPVMTAKATAVNRDRVSRDRRVVEVAATGAEEASAVP